MDHPEIRRYDERVWGFAYLHPRSEKKVAAKLRGAGVICYLPTMPHAYLMHSTKVVTQIPMFPGYLFLCTAREEATMLRYREKQILKIELQNDPACEDLLLQELQALSQCEELAQTQPILINPGIRAGDRVQITSGALKGLSADVVRRDDGNNSILVNLTLLGQHVEYPVSAEDLEKLTD